MSLYVIAYHIISYSIIRLALLSVPILASWTRWISLKLAARAQLSTKTCLQK